MENMRIGSKPLGTKSICLNCHTEVEKRKIKFGQCYYIEILACFCDARKIEAKYDKSSPRKDEER
jgi:hypothetical protein